MNKLYSGSQLLAMALLIVLLLAGSFAFGQSVQVTGTVRDGSGDGIPGVGITVKDAKASAVTDINGKFTIAVPNSQSVLVFTYIGFATYETAVAGRKVVDVQLKESLTDLNEVVVVGYGTQKKVNLSGAVAQIKSDDIAGRPVPNLTSALQGVSPGVTITRGSGQPGDESTGIRIRGVTSSNGADALVLVDGIQMDMNLVNPDDVESISVLKDASAAAIYGARAAGGVVLVTTKKGSGGKTKINFNSYYGLNITARQPERLPSWEEQLLIDEARFNALGTREYTPEMMEWIRNPNFQYRENPGANRWEYFGSTDWVKEGMSKYNGMQNYALSVSGGDQKLNYLASGGYYQRDGVLRYGPDDNSRKNLKLNVNAELNKYLSVGFVGGYAGSFVNENSNGTGNIIANLYRSRNRQTIFTPAEDQTGQPYNGDLQVNAIDIQKNAGLETRNYETFQGKLNLTVKNLVKGLTADFTGWRNQDSYNMEANRRTLVWYGRTTELERFSINKPNSMEMIKNRGFHNNFQGVLNYDLTVKNHHFKLLGGASYEEYRKDEVRAQAQTMVNNDFFSFNFADPLTKQNFDLVETWAIGSVFGRFNYDFSEKYLFEASFRYDGSSRLAPENRWQLFPSFSAAWRINQESFIKDNLPVVSNLKLRASWGQLGNGSVLGLYDYIPLLSAGLGESRSDYPNVIFNGQQSQFFFQKQLSSPTKSWETVQQANIGIDLGLLNERLLFTADIFEKRNKDMLAAIKVPSIIGVETGTVNVGELKSYGWELDIKWRDKIGSVGYNVGFNISDNQNKVIKYDGRSSVNGGRVELLEGYPLNSVWGYKTDGYFQTQQEADDYKARVQYPFAPANAFKPGDVKYLDLNGDGRISAGGATPEDPGDLTYLGTTSGRYTYGMDLGLNWKGIDFSVMFQGVAKRAFLLNNNALVPFNQSAFMPYSIFMDRWTPENPNAMFPRLYQGNTYNYQASDRSVQNGSYLRLKNVQLGYTIPFRKKFIQNMRVYLAGQDLWERTDVLSVFDPEVGNDADTGTYPFFRTVSFGLNVTF
ncbi:SusC/RagA family TonB-linked outer membrane protein [Pedobacter ginsengisoli]|uniref:SusC/RagA family TonB-linked outer membrane protein n=1 Tax=Pedobacter ginsengisoli TaxID=363852 RepID=UPI002551C7EE|nr:TonB-dependent receptor [Pedobacter ginsengisoli]